MKKRHLTYLFVLFATGISMLACKQNMPTVSETEEDIFNKKTNDTVVIENDSLEYDVIIIDPGFNTWLASIARPRGFYTQNYMEQRNILFVNEWNRRVTMPFQYNPSLYELQINYYADIDYGYEVNYKLYNYFIYFQRKYDQRLTGFIPRI